MGILHPAQLRVHVLASTSVGKAVGATAGVVSSALISLAMMSLMQTLAKDDSPDMSAPRAALIKQLEEVATKDWMAALLEGK